MVRKYSLLIPLSLGAQVTYEPTPAAHSFWRLGLISAKCDLGPRALTLYYWSGRTMSENSREVTAQKLNALKDWCFWYRTLGGGGKQFKSL